MNEEISTPETAVELDTDIVKTTLVDSTLNNEEYDIKTAHVTRTVNGEKMIARAAAEITESTTTNTAEKGEE